MNRFHKTFTILLALALLAPAAADAGRSKKKTKNVNVTLMSRNLYLGADIIKLATASDRNDFEQKATALFNTVRSTDFPSRAPLVAAEIRRHKPEFVGLQEVALWRSGPKDDDATPATKVEYDWLDELDDALDRRGLNYRVVRKQVEFDFEGPTSQGQDIRFTQQDAILQRVKKGVKSKNVESGNFESRLQVPLPSIGKTADVKRGFVALDANVRGAKFRFVNTHLEAYSAASRVAQAQELTGAGGPARYRGQAFLVGDLNSEAGAENDSADHFLDLGWQDTFFSKTRLDTPTCCQQEDIKNTQSQLDTRIDFVLAKPRVKVLSSRVVGNNPAVRTDSGLWTSDHAGVVSKVRLKAKR